MNPIRPRTAQRIDERLRSLVDAGQHRRAVAFAEQFSREFLPQLSAEELNRVTAMMEGADTIIDLEDWEAAQRKSGAAAPAAEASAQPLPSIAG